EPLQAGPVILEDNCFVGARSEVAEGVIVREGSVLSMGVFIGASDRIVDGNSGETFRGEVPAYSVVVPGSLPGKATKHGGAGPVSTARSSSNASTKRRAQKLQSTSCCGIEPTGAHRIIPTGPHRESGSNHRPGKRTRGSSHVNDGAAVLFPRPPQPQPYWTMAISVTLAFILLLFLALAALR